MSVFDKDKMWTSTIIHLEVSIVSQVVGLSTVEHTLVKAGIMSSETVNHEQRTFMGIRILNASLLITYPLLMLFSCL